ncbi:MAG: L-arabinonate dehydratase [Planctomycetota bacterium]|nr:L-arabinonate dehydratase [Planctomycetota bacterium]
MNDRLSSHELRSARWFAKDDLRSFGHRSRLKGMGFDDEDFMGKPVIGILNTWSDLNTCHSHFKNRVEEIKRGVLQAGGFPVEVPVMSLGEMLMKPTTMLYRNLLAMETEESLRCHPIDAAVLMGGCDKTVPALIMGALSANIPFLFFPAGPMLKARWKDQTLGSGTDAWKFWAERCAGNLCEGEWKEIENCIARSAGTCMTMGTASTMACIAESLGVTLPNAGSIPAVVSEHSRLAVASGRRAVDLAVQQVKPLQLLTRESFLNALITQLTLSGSTNAIVHMIAMAGRAGHRITLDDYDAISKRVPVLADLRPSGKYLMEDFYNAGGLAALLQQLRDVLYLDAKTVNGKSLGDQIQNATIIEPLVIRDRSNPLWPTGGTCVLRGNLAPDGCVIKTVAADPKLQKHTGPALVFNSYLDMKQRINSPELPVTPESVLVLRSAGPIGAPGFPEWGMLPLPDKILKLGIRDMVRISDARMSGTSYGTCVLHVAPESHIGGPLALVQDGDLIELDVESRSLNLLVAPQTLEDRRKGWKKPVVRWQRGYLKMFSEHTTQANQGCDFDFLHGNDADLEPEI